MLTWSGVVPQRVPRLAWTTWPCLQRQQYTVYWAKLRSFAAPDQAKTTTRCRTFYVEDHRSPVAPHALRTSSPQLVGRHEYIGDFF